MRAETLLQQMKRDAVHVCIVIDEHGGIAGLVTLEDLIEELVGEISDEYDRPGSEVVELAPGRYRVSGRMDLEDVGELFGVELEDDDVDSIGGLLGKELGRIPTPGATAVVRGLLLTGGASRGPRARHRVRLRRAGPRSRSRRIRTDPTGPARRTTMSDERDAKDGRGTAAVS